MITMLANGQGTYIQWSGQLWDWFGIYSTLEKQLHLLYLGILLEILWK